MAHKQDPVLSNHQTVAVESASTRPTPSFSFNRQAIWYHTVRSILRFLFFLLTDFKVIGQENIPPDRPLLLTVNHISAIDVPAMMVAFPYQAAAFAASKHQKGFYGFILRRFDIIFVKRGLPDRQALRQALEHLNRGGILGLAPEGTRSPTRSLIRGKPGAAFLALQSQATILPIAITGTETLLQAWRRLRRPKIRIVYGKPYKLSFPEGSKPDLQALSDQMMLRIAALLPPSYRGVYADWPALKGASHDLS